VPQLKEESDWHSRADKSACHELDKEAACCEVFEFAGRSRPLPEFAEFTGKAIAALGRMINDP